MPQEDADNLDMVLSPGDQYHITFDRPTDQHVCSPTCRGGPEYVLRLFTFSAPLASAYVGEWSDNRTFTITATRVDPGFVAPSVGATVVALRPPKRKRAPVALVDEGGDRSILHWAVASVLCTSSPLRQ